MIKKFLTFMAFASAFTIADTLYAQNTYLPILEVGKEWNYMRYRPGKDGLIEPKEYWTVKAVDKVEEDGHQIFTTIYQNFAYDDKPLISEKTYEENGVLWSYENEREGYKPVLDFNLEVGDKVVSDLEVVWKDYVDIEGVMRCVIAIGLPGSIRMCYWIEGIGNVNEITMLPVIMTTDGVRSCLKECWMGDKCLFDYYRMDEYMSGIDLSEVKSMTSQEEEDAPLYDILGRRITAPAPGQLYIQSGKKHVAK